MKYVPMYDILIIKPCKAPDKTKGGIVIPDKAQEQNRTARGEVLAIGPGRLGDDGKLIPVHGVSVGNVVLYEPFRADKVEDDDGTELVFVRSAAILGVEA